MSWPTDAWKGETGALARDFDWSATPLGPLSGWPRALLAIVSFAFESAQPAYIAWGPDLTSIYNDGYIPFLGTKHPQAFGTPYRSTWAEIWEEYAPVVEATLEGRSQRFDDQPIALAGRERDVTYFSFSYTPLRDDEGRVVGLLTIATETTEKVLALRSVEDERGRLAQMFEQAPSFMTLLRGPEHRFELANAAYLRLIGERDVVGRTLREALPETVAQGYADLLDRVRASGEAFSAAGAAYAAQEEPGGPLVERFVDFVFQPVLDGEGQVDAIFVEGSDVTERMRGIAALKDREQRLSALAAASSEAFFSMDPDWQRRRPLLDGRILPDQVEPDANWLDDLVHPDDHILVVAAVGQAIGTKGLFQCEHRVLRGDGSTGWTLARAVPLLDADGTVREWFGAATDVSERRQAEEDLRTLTAALELRVTERTRERDLMARILENTDAFVHVVDLDYRWLAINPAGAREFERVFGVWPKVGDRMLDLLADQPDQRAGAEAVWSRALGGEEFTAVARFGDPETAGGYYEMKFSVLLDESGRRVGASQIVTDVSRRIADETALADAQEQLRQSQKMEAVGQLTGGIAHDFNNLLAGISGSLDLMQARIAQGRVNDLDRYMVGAQGAARRAAALTHRLLAFSRRQTLEPKATDVNRLVSGLEDLVRRTVGPAITLETVASGGLWSTLVDPNQLENALLNLCINARDAMPDGGRLTIETANRWLDERAGRERDLPPGQYVSLCVSDNGTGMAASIIERAFDPFFTTKPIGVGTGLGLSMIYGFVRQSGGQVRIYSEVGQGTMVCLYLPRHHVDEVADAPIAALVPSSADAGETVLVIDDEPIVRMLVVDILEDLGYVALEAGDGPQGLKVIASDARIDLLVTDVGLPNGMNGRQVADAARELRPGLKVLFVTGYAENAVLSHGHLDPGMQVVTKPFDVNALATRIKTMIAGG
ncbi:PAS domain-containing protein [Aureimonas sp. AU12]|uniref:PAS domain-containing protein n=1 Tax=Aureimonas sp. AU12 TaxID=1638161 RepID=UPI0009E97427|nr:PAS domain-containing protein [Aureimonas sp. AU12]